MSNSKAPNRRFRKIKIKLHRMKRRAQRRVDAQPFPKHDGPVFSGSNIHYEMADRAHGLDCGGLGALHLLARRVGLIEAIDRDLHLLKLHLPYHESDHVLNIAYNLLCGGDCLEDLELRRNDEVYLNALGAVRIPDPTTAGDFCRRFKNHHVDLLQDIINEVRLNVWAQQPAAFFEEAVIDADGTLTQTYGECKQGMELSYKRTWGYHPLLVSLANTQEVLYLMNRSGGRPSHEGAWHYLDRSAGLCRSAGFGRITFRGDTDFSQTAHLDRWDAQGYRFVFGMNAMPNLVQLAENLPESAWKRLKRPPNYRVKTQPRRRPENVKERVVEQAGYENIKLIGEDVTEFDYQPGQCGKAYRLVVVRKNLSVKKGEQVLFDDVRYLFYITNDPKRSTTEVVFFANDRCNQENLIAQLKGGANALDTPTGDLISNAAYMVMASLAWTLKTWFALLLPENGAQAPARQAEKRAVLAMEFKTFVNGFMRLPCQVIRAGRRFVYRLLSWNRWMEVLVRNLEVLNGPRLC